MRLLTIIAAALFSLSFPTIVAAQDFDRVDRAYEDGDYLTVLRELRPLAEQGNAAAQFNLGLLYQNGRGVPQNYAEAVRLYRLAAEQGDADAQFNLGHMYQGGQGVPQNYIEAVRWLRMSAAKGLARPQVMLGGMYYYGKGVPQNYEISYMWLNLAAAKGYERAASARDNLAGNMTPEQIGRAQQLSAECLARNYQGCAE